jgi:hypothetical protein
VWDSSLGFPGYIVRLDPTKPNPSETALAEVYEIPAKALRGRQSGVDLKPPQAAVVKSNGGERCGKVGTRFRQV